MGIYKVEICRKVSETLATDEVMRAFILLVFIYKVHARLSTVNNSLKKGGGREKQGGKKKGKEGREKEKIKKAGKKEGRKKSSQNLN